MRGGSESMGDRGQVTRHRAGLTEHDVRLRTYRNVHASCASLHQVEGDLHPGAARTYDQDLGATKRLRIAVLRRVQQAGLEALAPRPRRDRGRVLVPRRDYDLAGGLRTGRALKPPIAIRTVNPIDAHAETYIELVLLGVVLEVPDHLITRRKQPRSLRVTRPRQLRGQATGVQPQPVVASAP